MNANHDRFASMKRQDERRSKMRVEFIGLGNWEANDEERHVTVNTVSAPH